MSQVGSAFVVVKPIVADFRAEVAQGVSRSLGSATIPIPVKPQIPTGAKVAWETLASGAAIPKVIPVPVQPEITPAAAAKFKGEVGGLRGLLLGAGQSAGARAVGISALAGSLFLFGKASFAAVKGAANLEQELNVFQQVSGATADQMARVREEARKLGADISLPAVSAGDAAATMTDLAKAGLSVDDVLNGTRGTLQLAAAAQLDFAAATDLAANALNAFQLPGSDAVQIADLLAGAANAAQGDISDFGIALSQSAAVAHQAGLSVQQTVTFLTELAKAGIAGSDAGTSLRVALLRLIAPTKEANDIFKALGIQITDAAGNVRVDVFEQLRRAMERLNPATRNTALATIFGTDAIRSAAIFTRDGAKGFSELEQQVSRQGQAAATAAARTKGLSGSVSGLSSNVQTLGTDLGTIVLPALTAFVRLLNTEVSGLDRTVVATANAISFLGDKTSDAAKKTESSGWFQTLEHTASATLDFGARAQRATDQVLHLRGAIKATGEVAPLAFPNLKGFAGAGDRSSPQFDRAVKQAASAGIAVGKAFAGAAGTEITKRERSVIDAAKKTVRDAQTALQQIVREGAAAVEQSAIDAKQSLTSIGQGLASQVVTLLDTGALAQRITALTGLQNQLIASRDALQARLDRSQQALQRTNLARTLRDAQEDLQRAQNQLVGGAPSTAQSRAGNRQFLRPFEERVKDAQAALQEFSAQADIDKATAKLTRVGTRISNLGVQLDAQKAKIQQTLNDIIARFNAGLLSGPQVNAQVAALLQKNVGPMAKAGKAQGFAFKQAFALQLAALQQQIAAILGGPRTAKTGAEPTIVKPADALKAATANRLAAERSVKDAITAKGGTNDLLAQILAQTKRRPTTKTSADVAPVKPKPRVGSR